MLQRPRPRRRKDQQSNSLRQWLVHYKLLFFKTFFSLTPITHYCEVAEEKKRENFIHSNSIQEGTSIFPKSLFHNKERLVKTIEKVHEKQSGAALGQRSGRV